MRIFTERQEEQFRRQMLSDKNPVHLSIELTKATYVDNDHIEFTLSLKEAELLIRDLQSTVNYYSTDTGQCST